MFDTRAGFWPFNIENEMVEDRRKFIYNTFMQLIFYLLAGLIQWVTFILVPRPSALELVISHESALVVTFFMSMIFFLMFATSSQLRQLPCINWVTTLLIVESQVVAIGLLAARTDLLRLLLSFLVVSVIVVLAILGTVFIPYDITQHATIWFLVSFCVFILSVYAATLHIILKVTWPFFLYCCIVVLLVLLIMAYHVQTVMGKGQIRTSPLDTKFAALLLFHDFLALFMLTFYWAPTRGYNQ